eukprot:TRINITY_DN25024_c0_g1_i3.p1 TRINITY_DN25024_c0_g1~~TRINITY_DN25024_c0_g1_i3.p1  ORF type:complete len:168 (-),score=22.35 TRINITY_DN25024_c0_g1_i3:1103-1606(-)
MVSITWRGGQERHSQAPNGLTSPSEEWLPEWQQAAEVRPSKAEDKSVAAYGAQARPIVLELVGPHGHVATLCGQHWPHNGQHQQCEMGGSTWGQTGAGCQRRWFSPKKLAPRQQDADMLSATVDDEVSNSWWRTWIQDDSDPDAGDQEVFTNVRRHLIINDIINTLD